MRWLAGWSTWDHPRVRGEQLATGSRVLQILGSPPRARGTATRRAAPPSRSGITPACAGNRCRTPRRAAAAEDHPRVRGEQPVADMVTWSAQGSPPRARGTDRVRAVGQEPGGITPACAGNSASRSPTRRARGDHPRVRGEQGWAEKQTGGELGSPPRARGTDEDVDCRPADARITPACAGNSRRGCRRRAGGRDHPRVRGEQSGWCRSASWSMGSPPRARGTVPFPRRSPWCRGITPACAGNSAHYLEDGQAI